MMGRSIETSDDAVVQRETLSTTSLMNGGLAHEINNALAALLTSLSALAEVLEPDAAERAREELVAAQDAARHIASVVRDVQSLLRPERGTLLVDPRAAVERAIRLARRPAEAVACLRAELDDVPQVRGSDAWLTQVALNLILNAIEACRAGAPRSGHVLVSLHRDGDAIILAVSDDGVGMEMGVAERIFHTIVSTRPGDDHGLGLPITCRLVRAMGGVIEFDSEPGTGTAFRVRLPSASDMP
jgi:two-component system, NtrC family, sensor kinase